MYNKSLCNQPLFLHPVGAVVMNFRSGVAGLNGIIRHGFDCNDLLLSDDVIYKCNIYSAWSVHNVY